MSDASRLTTTASTQICTVRDCPIHGKPPSKRDLVKFQKDGSVKVDFKRYLRWLLTSKRKQP